MLTRILGSPWLAWFLVMPLLALVALKTLQLQSVEAQTAANQGKAVSQPLPDAVASNAPIRNDYANHGLLGRLLRESGAVATYEGGYLISEQHRVDGASTLMSGAYPLQAMIAVLPRVGVAWSCMIFVVASLLLYLWTLTRSNAKLVGAAMLAVYPSLVQVIRLGEDGMLMGSLIGLFLLTLNRQPRLAGVTLGLTFIKPHFAVGVGLVAVVQRRWAVVATAAAVVVLACVAATILLGAQIWPTFLLSVSATGDHLRHDTLPLYRLSSIYAGVRSLGTSPSIAMAVHAICALIGLIVVALASRRGLRSSRLLALACFVIVLASPYTYDCDLACLAIAVSSILPELLARADTFEIVLFYLLSWMGTGAGIAQHAALIASAGQSADGAILGWSFQALGLLGAAGLAAAILRRRQRMSVVPDAPARHAPGGVR